MLKKIKTKYFSEITIDEAEIIHFPDGICGFEDYHSFVKLHFEGDTGLMQCLQSVDLPNLAFVLLNPFYIKPNYLPAVPDEELDSVGVEGETALEYYVIASIKDNIPDSTVNLKGPIVINPQKMLGKQLVLSNPEYLLKYPISGKV